MIETTVIRYLSEALDVPVYGETPREVPSTYVRVEKTGSGYNSGLQRATLAIQSITSGSLLEAATLNEEAKTAMRDLISLTNVFRCDCQTDYNYTDTRTKERRYQAVFDIYYME